MKALTEIIAEYKAAEARFEPFRKELRERMQAAVDTYKRVGREHRVSGSDWQYAWADWMGWVDLADMEINVEKQTVYIEYGRGEHNDGETILTFDEIENAEQYAQAEAVRVKAKHLEDLQNSKEYKRRELQRQLAELDN